MGSSPGQPKAFFWGGQRLPTMSDQTWTSLEDPNYTPSLPRTPERTTGRLNRQDKQCGQERESRDHRRPPLACRAHRGTRAQTASLAWHSRRPSPQNQRTKLRACLGRQPEGQAPQQSRATEASAGAGLDPAEGQKSQSRLVLRRQGVAHRVPASSRRCTGPHPSRQACLGS